MEQLVIEGGARLNGEIEVSGSKNAALPIMAATLLTDEPCVIHNVPRLRDTVTMSRLLESMGKRVSFEDHTLIVEESKSLTPFADYALVSTMRGSFCVLGPLLGRLRQAQVSLPGGCVIGVRPVDLHLKGLKALGARLDVDGGYVVASARRLKGQRIYLGGVFGSSVLATANVLMAAVYAKGWTYIEYAACEPEIGQLVQFLRAMGADVQGEGTPRIVIKGVNRLHGAEFTIGPDRIEAGTYMLAAAATGSRIRLRNAPVSQLWVLVDKLQETGVACLVEEDMNEVTVVPSKKRRPCNVTTSPYPGFPTDLQAQFTTYAAQLAGVSVITDKVFPDRFMHIAELNRMGAQIHREGNSAVVQGVRSLRGTTVMASDLRASAALVIAGLCAHGTTVIRRCYHIDRGYERIDEKLQALGASIRREEESG